MAPAKTHLRGLRVVAISGLALLVALLMAGSVWHTQLRVYFKALMYRPQTRIYYVAAENASWDYAPMHVDPMTNEPVPAPWGNQTVYQKTRYIQYTDDSFTTKVPQPQSQGILGPTIRGVVGDTIKVVFYNKGSKDYSMHPHGLEYDKDNEGSVDAMESVNGDFDGDSGAAPVPQTTGSMAPKTEAEKEMAEMGRIMPNAGAGAKVAPGAKYTYTWKVRPEAGPTGNQSSRVWLYHSHVGLHDIYDGLVGPIVVTAPGYSTKDATPYDVKDEYMALFMIFDESTPGMTDDEREAATKHTINGMFFDNLQGYYLAQGEKTRWYVMDLGNEVDVHTPHWHGNTVRETSGQTTDVLELLPASMQTVDMVPDKPGTWMFHCHVVDHMNAGMMASYTVYQSH